MATLSNDAASKSVPITLAERKLAEDVVKLFAKTSEPLCANSDFSSLEFGNGSPTTLCKAMDYFQFDTGLGNEKGRAGLVANGYSAKFVSELTSRTASWLAEDYVNRCYPKHAPCGELMVASGDQAALKKSAKALLDVKFENNVLQINDLVKVLSAITDGSFVADALKSVWARLVEGLKGTDRRDIWMVSDVLTKTPVPEALVSWLIDQTKNPNIELAGLALTMLVHNFSKSEFLVVQNKTIISTMVEWINSPAGEFRNFAYGLAQENIDVVPYLVAAAKDGRIYNVNSLVSFALNPVFPKITNPHVKIEILDLSIQCLLDYFGPYGAPSMDNIMVGFKDDEKALKDMYRAILTASSVAKADDVHRAFSTFAQIGKLTKDEAFAKEIIRTITAKTGFTMGGSDFGIAASALVQISGSVHELVNMARSEPALKDSAKKILMTMSSRYNDGTVSKILLNELLP